jgi:hypothetical protein
MKCPKCQFVQIDSNYECERCGVIFSKYYKFHSKNRNHSKPVSNSYDVSDSEGTQLSKLLSSISTDIGFVSFAGRLLIYIGMLFWGVKFIFASIDGNYAGHSFMHLINLPFHEAGHLLFRPFGSFITSLGGSLGQLLMPLICLFVLLFKTRDAFGASVALWWFGQNFFDMAPYINDARAGILCVSGKPV